MKGDNIKPKKFLDADGNLLVYGCTLQDELISLGWSHSTEAVQMVNILYNFMNKYNIHSTSYWYIGNYGIWGEIDRGYPVIAFALYKTFAKKVNSTYDKEFLSAGHATVIYGYNKNYYICNTGWWKDGNEKVYILDVLWGGNNQLRIW